MRQLDGTENGQRYEITPDAPEPKAASVEGSPESRPMQGVDAGATGSVPVSSAEVLAFATEVERGYNPDGQRYTATHYPQRVNASELLRKADIVEHCCEILRRHAAAATERQPEENDGGEPRPGGSA